MNGQEIEKIRSAVSQEGKKFMGRAENRGKAQARAAWLKVHSPVRTHFMCPWDCGRPIKVDGGASLLNHLVWCKGNPRKVNQWPRKSASADVRRDAGGQAA